MQFNRKIAAGLAAGALALGLLGSTPAAAAADPGAGQGPAPVEEQAAKWVWGTVVAQSGLYVRAYPTTDSQAIGSYAYNARVKLSCRAESQPVAGNRTWFKLADRTGWVAARYVVNHGSLPTCAPTLLQSPN